MVLPVVFLKMACVNFGFNNNPSSYKELYQLRLQVKHAKSQLTSTTEISRFVTNFPFGKLHDYCSTRKDLKYCTQILDDLINYEEFYKLKENVAFCMDFLISNLKSFSKNDSEICHCLKLLSHLVLKNQGLLSEYRCNVEGLFDTLCKLMLTIPNLSEANFEYITKIVEFLFDSSSYLINEHGISSLFAAFKNHWAVLPMIKVCKILLTRFKTCLQSCSHIILWLTQEAPIYLDDQSLSDKFRIEVISCLNIYLEMCNCSHEDEHFFHQSKDLHINLIQMLMKRANSICRLSSKMRSQCFHLLEYLLKVFLPILKNRNIYQSLQQLPFNVEDWPICYNNDVFLVTCYFLASKSTLIWNKKDIIECTINFFDRNKLVPLNLVFIYNLYPLVAYEEQGTRAKIFENGLLETFLKHFDVLNNHIDNIHQVRWLLKSSKLADNLKRIILLQWIRKNDEKSDVELISIIESTSSENLLLQILLSKEVGNIYYRVCTLVKKLPQEQVSKKLLDVFLHRFRDNVIFTRIILTEPQVPKNYKFSLHLCSLVASVIPTIREPQLTRAACWLSSKALANTNNKAQALREFCRNSTVISHLIRIAEEIDDHTAVEVIRLLKVIVAIQVRYGVKLVCVESSFYLFLRGSNDKVTQGIKLFCQVLPYGAVVILPARRYLKSVFVQMLNLSYRAELQEIVCQGLTSILHKEPCLAQLMNNNCKFTETFSSNFRNDNEIVSALKDSVSKALQNERKNCVFPESWKFMTNITGWVCEEEQA